MKTTPTTPPALAPWIARVRAALAHLDPAPADDIIEELAEHVRATYETARADGLDKMAAERRVDDCLTEWQRQAAALNRPEHRAPAPTPPGTRPAGSPVFIGLAEDVRYALRRLRRRPRFALMVALTMAIGIGPAAALFNVVYTVLIEPLPWPAAQHVVVLKETRGGQAPRFGSFSNTAYYAWKDAAAGSEAPATIEDIGAWSGSTVTVTSGGDSERVRFTNATASVFRVLGIQPLLGTLYSDADERERVMVITERLWRRRFGADPAIVGQPVQLDGVPYIVRGVVADAMSYPDRQSQGFIAHSVPRPAGNLLGMSEAIARLKPGVSIEAAAAEGTARGKFAADTGPTTVAIFGQNGAISVSAQSLDDALVGEVRRPLVILMLAVSLLVVIAITNLVSLHLTDGLSRRRELALRAALGANTRRITMQLAFEALVTGLGGTALSLLTAWGLQRAFVALMPAGFPRAPQLSFDVTVVLFAIGAAAVASLAAGVVPALLLRRATLTGALTEDGSAPSGAGRRTVASRSRALIVAGQVAIACILLVAASLLGRSFLAALNADRGYDASKVSTAGITMAGPGYTPQRRMAIIESVLERLSASPAIDAAAFASEQPFTPGGSTSAMTLTPAGGGTPVMAQASPRQVSPEYFAALGLRMIAGRALRDDDTRASEPVSVVNETFARKYFPGGAIGVRIPMGIWGQNITGEATIVGIAGDVKYANATQALSSLPEIYFSYKQLPIGLRSSTATFIVRGGGDAATLTRSLRGIVREADAGASLATVMTIEDRLLASSLARPRLYAVLLAAFACVALAVTGVGLFGTISYAMAQRVRELALRSALGASRRDLVRLVLAQGLAAVVIGIVAGLAVARWAAGFTSSVLFGVTADDPATYVIAPLVIALMALAACVAPARRAWRIDAVRAMRAE
jgi:putative ABC transport system permease protein